jgi:DNA helicase-2/ATP-dependent DNA helicase PcrA
VRAIGAAARADGPIPSDYQQAIYDFVVGDAGHGLVDAVPGSGKTTTLVGACNRVDVDHSAHFFAFNRHITRALQSRLPAHAGASTIHSLGHRTLGVAGYGRTVNDKKYAQLCAALLEARYPSAAREELRRVADVLLGLVGMARLTLTDPHSPDALRCMALSYELEMGDRSTWQRAVENVAPVLECGRRLARAALDIGRVVQEYADDIPYVSPLPRPSASGVIDYIDMVWLPIVEDLQPRQTDWVMVDEGQDLNRCQLELVLRACARGGRLLFVGDRRQAIYAFSGADARSMERIEERTQAERLPLSICYRCPSSHVALAGQVYPGIEPAPGAAAGLIEEDVAEDDAVDMLRPGDLVLCRTTAPLVPLCYRLIRCRKPARLRGHDIGVRLLSVLKRVEKQPGFTMADFLAHLQRCEAEAPAELARQEADEMAVQSMTDKFATVRVIYEAERPRTMQELRDAITAIFPKDVDHPVIWLSTVHRAKGLEAERVFLLRPELLPHPKAKTPVQAEQERNLLYVALTRAKQALYVVEGSVPRP